MARPLLDKAKLNKISSMKLTAMDLKHSYIVLTDAYHVHSLISLHFSLPGFPLLAIRYQLGVIFPLLSRELTLFSIFSSCQRDQRAKDSASGISVSRDDNARAMTTETHEEEEEAAMGPSSSPTSLTPERGGAKAETWPVGVGERDLTPSLVPPPLPTRHHKSTHVMPLSSLVRGSAKPRLGPLPQRKKHYQELEEIDTGRKEQIEVALKEQREEEKEGGGRENKMREVERKSKDKCVGFKLKRPLAGPLSEDLRETPQHGVNQWDKALYPLTATIAKTMQKLITTFIKTFLTRS